MFGRRGPVEAGFTPKELGELREFERCAVIVDGGQLPGSVEGDFEGRVKGIKEKNLALLRELAAQDKPDMPIQMHMGFYAAPVEIWGASQVEALRLERTQVADGRAQGTGEFFDVPCAAVVLVGERLRTQRGDVHEGPFLRPIGDHPPLPGHGARGPQLHHA